MKRRLTLCAILAVVCGVTLIAALPATEDCGATFGDVTTFTNQTNSIDDNGSGECVGVGYADYNRVFDSGNTYSNDQYCQFVYRGGSYTGCGVRMSGTGGSAQGYNMRASDVTSSMFQEVTAGTAAQIGNVFADPTIGNLVRLEIVGTTLTVKYDGVTKDTVSDATIASGSAGIMIYSNVATLDNWEGGNIGGAAAVQPKFTLLGVGGLQ